MRFTAGLPLAQVEVLLLLPLLRDGLNGKRQVLRVLAAAGAKGRDSIRIAVCTEASSDGGHLLLRRLGLCGCSSKC